MCNLLSQFCVEEKKRNSLKPRNRKKSGLNWKAIVIIILMITLFFFVISNTQPAPEVLIAQGL